jgi:hypothetical protein
MWYHRYPYRRTGIWLLRSHLLSVVLRYKPYCFWLKSKIQFNIGNQLICYIQSIVWQWVCLFESAPIKGDMKDAYKPMCLRWTRWSTRTNTVHLAPHTPGRYPHMKVSLYIPSIMEEDFHSDVQKLVKKWLRPKKQRHRKSEPTASATQNWNLQ